MLFHKRRPLGPIRVSINNKAVDIFPQFNYLGIIVDAHLSWKARVVMVTGKLSKINGMLNRLKYIYRAQVLLTIYKSLFVPHINHGCLVWGQNCDSISKLQKHTVTKLHILSHFSKI